MRAKQCANSLVLVRRHDEENTEVQDYPYISNIFTRDIWFISTRGKNTFLTFIIIRKAVPTQIELG